MTYPGNFKWWVILFALALLPAPASHAAARLLRATDMTVARGETNRLFIVLDAVGDENAAGFSLCYDTNLLTFIRAVRGAHALSATLNVNTNQVFRGRVGIALGLSSGEVFDAGSLSLVEVSFRAAPGITSVTTEVGFSCDLPIPREVVDVEAQVVEADYADARVAIVGLCNYSLSTNATAFAAVGGTNSVVVTVANECSWGVLNTNDWITITSGAGGTGGGILRYSVSANFAATARTGRLEIAGQTLSVNQAGSTCAYALSPASRGHGSGAATNTFSMTASNGCAWAVSNANSWLTIRSGGSGSGNGTVTYQVEANPNPVARIGLLQLAGQTFTVTQAAVVCSYKLSPTNKTHGAAAATNSIGVTTSSGCRWTVVNSNAWITITSGTQGQGTDNVDYEIPANPTIVGRTGWVSVADQVFSVGQSGASCTFVIAPASGSYGSGSATGLVTVTALAGCTWAVINTNSWITIHPGASGMGNGSVGYTVSANPLSTTRSGMVKIAGVNHQVTQAGVFTCTYKLSVTNRTHGPGAASNSISITASNACAWSVVNTNTWISITSETNGAGNDSVTYAIVANPNFTERTGVVRIAGQSFTVIQQAAVCEFSISTSSRTHGFGATTSSVSLTTASGCAWTARSTNSWIVITPITSGTASATVGYRLVANPNPVQRTSVVMIADQLLTLIQRAAPCTFEVSPESRLHGTGIETGLVSVVTSSTCPWGTENTNAWITILSATNGTGNGIVRYRVAANPTHSTRTGVLTIAGADYTVTQTAVPCSFAIAPLNRTHGSGIEAGTVSVTTSSDCSWNVSDTNSWISITSASSGTNSGQVSYTVAANPTLSPRTAVFVIAGRSFTVTQAAGSCTYKLSPVTRAHGSGTATNTVSVTTSNQCAWTIANSNNWITINSATNRTGNAELTYGLAANPSASLERTGLVVIAKQTFVLIQHGASCTFSISASTRMHGAGATSNSVSLTTVAGCGWSVTNSNDWITITSATTGSGNAAVNYRLAANTSFAERTGAVQIADKVLTVIQHGATCAYSISTGTRMHGSGMATNSVSLTTSNECAWTVVNTNEWLNLTSSTNGMGSATISYTLAANPSLSARTGMVTIADETLTLVQSGITCEFSISPATRTHGPGLATNSINLSTTTGCAWSVVNPNEWIAITGSGTSNATVNYSVAPNPSSLDRTGLVVIADQTFALIQRGAPCDISISPGTRTHGPGDATNSLSLATLVDCAWKVVNSNDWITITSASNGIGSTTVHYLAAANPSALERTGLVVVADATFTLIQRGVTCEFSISPATRTHGTSAATNSLNLTTAAGCEWNVVNTNDWITITSPNRAAGSNAVNYTVAANSSSLERTGLVIIAEQAFVLIQRGVVCEFSISPATRTHGTGAATNSINLTTAAGCAWSVLNNNDWIAITSEREGIGSAIVGYTLAANSSSLERTGLVAIAGQTFALVQRGVACEFSLSPATRTHGTGAASNSVSLTAIAGCAWNMVNTNDWITILSEGSGTGSASFNYLVAANPSPLERTGLVAIANQTLVLIQHGLACEYSISPATRTHGTGTATNSVSLAAAAGCAWSVVNSNNWITITSPDSGTGSNTVNYAVTANPASTERSGAVLIAGEVFTVVQRGAGCTFSISPPNKNHGFAAATNAVTLNTPGDCAWTIVNTNDWITITSATNGSGGTNVGYTLAANPSTVERTGLVTIGDQILTLTQKAAPCSFDLTPPNGRPSSDAGTGLVAVATSANCSWTVVNTNSWITLTAPAAGLGNGSVAYAVDANPSPIPRTGVVTIGGENFRVTQGGVPCAFALSASSRLHEAGTETGSVGVITVTGCSWTVNNPNEWIDILAGANGAGSGTVTYRVNANPSIEPRSGLLTIAGEILSVSQPGAACAYKLSPTNRMHGYGMTTGTVSVVATIGCSWSVVNTNDWLIITSGTNGTGNGNVTYSVPANTTILGRTGVVMIAEHAFLITQQATPCTIALSPATRVHGRGATTGTVSLTTLAGCTWQIVNTNDWLAVTSSLSGTGTASVIYTVDANASTLDRSGVILVADQLLTVTQRGIPCQFSIAPETVLHGAGPETGTVSLTAGTGCAWSVINTNDWIRITSSLNGAGPANVAYAVEANPAILSRSGVIVISGQVFTVNQQAAPCGYSLSTNHAIIGASGGGVNVNVSALPGCAWTAVNDISWITITAGTAGNGNGTVTCAVAANSSGLARTGVMVIAGQTFTVSQAVSSEAVKPVVTITSPAVNARTTNSLLTGTARDNLGISLVRIQVGDGPFLTAIGTSAWSINLSGLLAPGTNVVRVQSVDSSGNESVMVTRPFIFVPTSPLTVRTSGTGTVTPNQTGRRLEVGRSYTVVATPGAGQVFSNWTGGVTGGSSRLTFVMQSNLMIQANFVPNPFLSVKGTYTGLFHPGQAEHARSGFLSLALTERGSFTATMLTGGRRLVFSGAFNLLGTATKTVPRAGTNALVVELTVDLAPGGTQISGVVRDGIMEAPLMAARATFNTVTNPATAFAGRYTIILPATLNSTILPCGDGIGTVIVDRGGRVTFAGTLADGTPVAQRALLSPNGEWPLYAPLYAGKGSLLSGVTFTSLALDDLAGQFRWTKPALPLAKYYPAGFDVPWTPLLGSRYTAPGTNRVINITDGQLEFMGGNLAVPFTNHVTLSAGNKITNLDSNKLTLTFALPTGLLNGTAAIPEASKTVLFKGAVHQKRELAAGFFLGTNQSGRVEFTR